MRYGIDPERPSKIIVLSIFDREGEGRRILVGVRSGDTNPTHSDVVSVPTQRIPESLYADIVARCGVSKDSRPDCGFPERVRKSFRLSAPSSDSLREKGHNPVIYAVESLLNAKLGLGDSIECGKTSFIARPRALLIGEVFYEIKDAEIPGEKIEINGEPLFREQAVMLNIEVVLRGHEQLPNDTPSYRHLRWITLEEFEKLMTSRDASFLSHLFDGEGVHLCVHGMCLLSAHAALDAIGA